MEEYLRIQREKWRREQRGDSKESTIENSCGPILESRPSTSVAPNQRNNQGFSLPTSLQNRREVKKEEEEESFGTPTHVRIKRDEDFAKKLSLQFEMEERRVKPTRTIDPPETPTPVRIMRDEEFARRLHFEQFEVMKREKKQREKDQELALRLQQQLKEEERRTLVRVQQEVKKEQERIERDRNLATRLQNEREERRNEDRKLALRLQRQQQVERSYESDRQLAERLQREQQQRNDPDPRSLLRHLGLVQQDHDRNPNLFGLGPTIHQDLRGLLLTQFQETNETNDGGDDYEELMRLGEQLGDVKQRGTTKTTINSNTLEFVIRDPTKDVPRDCESCMVCYEEWEVGDHARRLNCMHCFHTKCIDKWLEGYNAICPICREPIKISEQRGNRN